ncbi:MAG: adenylosuccinate lyase [Deltaproteobacteria bacterium]|nr:adenylosuccinate lyase [Deltaproteobacteria bacterium]
MIPRYSRPAMAALWSEEEKYRRWLAVELFALEAWVRLGKAPAAAVTTVRRRAKVDVARIQAIEATVKHDVIAFLTSLTEQVGPLGRYLHVGLTSSDVVDTTFAWQLVDAVTQIEQQVTVLQRLLKRLARRHRDTIMIGRTHGIHAEPTTFGLKLARWYDAFRRHGERLRDLRPRLAVGKISGAVGTYAHVPPSVERYVLRKLKLTPEPVATQVVQRDRHAECFQLLALIGASVEAVALEIRHLQRTEVREVEESFTKGQKGSSAMPHKRNPILSENLCGLARLLRSYAGASLENVALWHERDISHSSVERVIGPDATIALDFMLDRLRQLLEGLQVYPQRMLANLNASGGLVFSQPLLLALVAAGCTREAAYAVVQRLAMRAWEGGEDFRRLVESDPTVRTRLAPAAIAQAFDPRRQLRHVAPIFHRVFGDT